VKALKSKELEKRLDIDENSEKEINKNVKSADAQKPKATLQGNKNNTGKHLPPKIPNRSSTSNENLKESSIPGSYLKNYTKGVPSTTKASSTVDTPKSIANNGNMAGKTLNMVSKNTSNSSKLSSDTEKLTAENCRALALYKIPTVSSQQKKQELYKPEENLPPWGNLGVNSKNTMAKRVTSATTRSTVTPRNKLKRGKSTTTCTALVVRDANKTHMQKDIKIRKNKGNRPSQKTKSSNRKLNTSGTNKSRTRLSSKDKRNSMKRLGISANLGSKTKNLSVEDEKKRIQGFLDEFFESDANAGKFTEAEKRKFTNNFKKAFIESQLGGIPPKPKKNNGPLLAALPAPPKIKPVPVNKPMKAILPSLPPKEEPKVEAKKAESDIKLGNVKFYSNAFTNNFNFITKKKEEPDDQFEMNPNFIESESDNFSDHKYHVDDQFFSPDSEEK
jgi:hypothetical protein